MPGSLAADRMACSDNAAPFPRGRQGKPRRRRSRRRALIGWGVSRRRRLAGDGHAPELVQLDGELVGGVPGLVALGDRLISRGDRSLTLGERGFALTYGAVALVDRGVAPGHHGVALGDRRLPLGQRRVQAAGELVDLLDCRFLSLRGLRALQFRVRRTLHPPIAVSARTLR
jgi:hypothetical protein